MPSRQHIEPNAGGFRRLSYTCRAGWIDWNHAGGMAQPLKNHVVDGSGLPAFNVTLEGRRAGLVEFGMSQGGGISGVHYHYVFPLSLSHADREAAALGMFLDASVGFERMQASFPWALIRRSRESSFSGEDLISNVVGFFAVMRGYTQNQMRGLLDEKSVEETYAIWDAQFGRQGSFSITNTTVTPVRYAGDNCVGRTLPGTFNSIVPTVNGSTWARLKTNLSHHYQHTDEPVDVGRDGGVKVIPPSAARRLGLDWGLRNSHTW